MTVAVSVSDLSHSYGTHRALDHVDLQASAGTLFALLGPNGSGKSTLFKILSTLMPPQDGNVRVADLDIARRPDAVRKCIGVLFQHPSLDVHLSVRENLYYQGRLYGLSRATVASRSTALLTRFGVADRANQRVGQLSGGLQRRVELAKAMLHGPQILILDEPSTGLDPNARTDLMDLLRALRDENGVLCLLTTHLMEEADQCDRVAVLDKGRLVAIDHPHDLKATVGGEVLTIQTSDMAAVVRWLRENRQIEAHVVDGCVRAEVPAAYALVPKLHEAFGDRIRSLTVGSPSLADAFYHLTGHRLLNGNGGAAARSERVESAIA